MTISSPYLASLSPMALFKIHAPDGAFQTALVTDEGKVAELVVFVMLIRSFTVGNQSTGNGFFTILGIENLVIHLHRLLLNRRFGLGQELVSVQRLVDTGVALSQRPDNHQPRSGTV